MDVRLIREVNASGRTGPINGMFALQGALRAAAPKWFHVGGSLRPGELPWYWHWDDGPDAALCAAAGEPFVCGPNILFGDSRRPCRTPEEQAVCQAASCRLLFTESEWYRRLIDRHRNPANRAPIVLWPYPIEPKPGGPVDPAEYDLLVYAKNGPCLGLVGKLQRRYRRCRIIQYGRYQRGELWQIARRSRCCCYLVDDDRGPLALAEILLCGCPTVGVPTGAPFIQQGRSGILLENLSISQWIEAIENCHEFDRRHVAALAAEQFDTGRIVETVIRALDAARKKT